MATDLSLKVDFQPATITADFEAMSEKLDKMIDPYKGITKEGILAMDAREAKICRADLNRIIKNVNDGRIAIGKEYSKPLEAFKVQVDALLVPAREAVEIIDSAVKEQEALERDARLEALEEHYGEFAPYLVPVVPYERFADDKWLTKTGFKKAFDQLEAKVSKVATDWEALKKANLAYAEESEAAFFRSLDLSEALNYNDMRIKEQAEIEKLKAQVEPEPEFEEEPEQEPEELVMQVQEPEPQPEPVEQVAFEQMFTYQLTIQCTENQKQMFIDALKRLGIHGNICKVGEVA